MRTTSFAAFFAVMLFLSCGAPCQSDPLPSGCRVIAGDLIKKISPIYPEDAKMQHLQGAVVLRAQIARDGHVGELSVVSGPEALRDSARTAVQQWVYTPYTLNGQPIEMDTIITLDFTFGRFSETPVTSAVPRSTHAQMAPAVIAGRVVSHPTLQYQDAEKVSGESVFRVLVGRDGSIQKAMPISGPAARRKADQRAVLQWKFEPFLLNGAPVEIETTISVISDFAKVTD